jgi:ribosomal protein S1
MSEDKISEREQALVGSLVEGEVEAVFTWGVIIDLGMSHVGLIDALYVDDDDDYQVGDRVSVYLDSFDSKKNEFILRPPGQVSVAERLKNLGLG